jgi:hypothetical protein
MAAHPQKTPVFESYTYPQGTFVGPASLAAHFKVYRHFAGKTEITEKSEKERERVWEEERAS